MLNAQNTQALNATEKNDAQEVQFSRFKEYYKPKIISLLLTFCQDVC